jgi:hypothetical protein
MKAINQRAVAEHTTARFFLGRQLAPATGPKASLVFLLALFCSAQVHVSVYPVPSPFGFRRKERRFPYDRRNFMFVSVIQTKVISHGKISAPEC